MTSISDVKLISLRTFIEPDGNLVPIENTDIPFDIRRIFYVFSVKDLNDRGRHSPHKTHQVLICLQGRVKVNCDDGRNRKQWILDAPKKALYIPEMIWDEQIYQSKDSILLSVCNTKYNKDDYITNWKDFINVN